MMNLKYDRNVPSDTNMTIFIKSEILIRNITFNSIYFRKLIEIVCNRNSGYQQYDAPAAEPYTQPSYNSSGYVLS